MSSHDVQNANEVGDIHLLVTCEVSSFYIFTCSHDVKNSYGICDINYTVAIEVTNHNRIWIPLDCPSELGSLTGMLNAISSIKNCVLHIHSVLAGSEISRNLNNNSCNSTCCTSHSNTFCTFAAKRNSTIAIVCGIKGCFVSLGIAGINESCALEDNACGENESAIPSCNCITVVHVQSQFGSSTGFAIRTSHGNLISFRERCPHCCHCKERHQGE